MRGGFVSENEVDGGYGDGNIIKYINVFVYTLGHPYLAPPICLPSSW